ncbi:Sorting nexin-10A [Nibea albiflora]|uniref:Sorting nexin-10A n=1 Tax=Nibea albiflora TaxID=240163 RepID=A0ACB7ESD8_NIBAL|nr:Sorting nexin-10A [Nibea albiflora]
MDGLLDNFSKTEFISICVQNPRLVREHHWQTHVDYEICLHSNSMCFRKKASCVRRRYSEFVWLRHCLEQNALIIDLPKLPPRIPFFSLRNAQQVLQRMKGMQEFLEIVLHAPLLLSDSRLHLFLQSELSIPKIERCARGKTSPISLPNWRPDSLNHPPSPTLHPPPFLYFSSPPGDRDTPPPPLLSSSSSSCLPHLCLRCVKSSWRFPIDWIGMGGIGRCVCVVVVVVVVVTFDGLRSEAMKKTRRWPPPTKRQLTYRRHGEGRQVDRGGGQRWSGCEVGGK